MAGDGPIDSTIPIILSISTLVLLGAAIASTQYAIAAITTALYSATAAVGAAAFVAISVFRQYRLRRRNQTLIADAVTRVLGGFALATTSEGDFLFDMRLRRFEVSALLILSEKLGDSAKDVWQAGGGEELLRQQMQRAISNDEVLRQQAEEGIKNWLPQLPRATKRLINRLRFLFVIAYTRDLLSDELDAVTIGRWAVFLERWPEWSAAVIRDPSFMAEIASAAAHSGTDPLKSLADDHKIAENRSQLAQFVNQSPGLAASANVLVHMQSDPGQAAVTSNGAAAVNGARLP